MKFILGVGLLFAALLTVNGWDRKDFNILCYYETESSNRDAPGNFNVKEIEQIMNENLCTHIVYAYATIGSNNKFKLPKNDIGENKQITRKFNF